MPSFPTWSAAVIFFAWTGSAALAQKLPDGYIVADNSVSPDGRYGIIVPKSAEEDTIKNPQNAVIDLRTGHLIGAIMLDPDYVAFDHINNGEIDPTQWSADDAVLLWTVDGKWGFETEMLVKLDGKKITGEINVLNLLEKEMLKRTQAASPKDYAAVKATSADYGSWYKDGFAIDCGLANAGPDLKFPLLYHCFLTSNTKGLEGVTNLDSRMTAEVSADGTIKVDDFHLGKDPAARNW
jgi:hypothetical protein